SAALGSFGYWLGLDVSLEFGGPMYPDLGAGAVHRLLYSDELSFGRRQYGDGSSSNGAITGTVRFPNGSPVPYAYVLAIAASGTYGAIADANGAYAIFEAEAG